MKSPRCFSVIKPLLPGLLMAVGACASLPESSEEQASQLLGEARSLLSEGRYDSARDTIMSLRRQYPTALDARRAAILTLDSIELMAARDSVARYEAELQAARLAFQQMLPRVEGHTNEAYYAQQRLVKNMEQHFDELCAKVKFFLRKIDIDMQH